jgi:Uncharacterized protein conserved in bacteria
MEKRIGDIDIIIKQDGSWWHEGGLIKRLNMARLFASVLQKRNEEYWLVTPVEELKIQVEDAPFVITDIAIPEDPSLAYDARDSIERSLKITTPPFLKKNRDGVDVFHVDLGNGLLGQCSRALHIQLTDHMTLDNHGAWTLFNLKGDVWSSGIIDG